MDKNIIGDEVSTKTVFADMLTILRTALEDRTLRKDLPGYKSVQKAFMTAYRH